MQIDRRTLLAGAAALASTPAFAKKPSLYRRVIVIDGLGGFSDPYATKEEATMTARTQAEIRASGITVLGQTVSGVGNGPKVWEETLANLDFFDTLFKAVPDLLMPVKTPADVATAKARGKFGLVFGTQDTSMIGTQLDRLAELKKRGVRQVQLTYNLRNLSGDGALEADNAGLSKLGRATIVRIEAERLLLDLSHGGAKTIEQAIAAATRPPIISHTGCRSLHDNPRNVWDASMKAVADKGGVVGIYFMPFLTADSKPAGADLIRHIEHAAKVCGEDHIAIGTDGDIFPTKTDAKALAAQKKFYEDRAAAGIAAPGEGPDVLNIVSDYNSLDKFERLAMDLGKRGWSDARVEKLLGANLVRLWGEVWG